MVSDEKATEIALEHENAQFAADALLTTALENGSMDNVSIIVVFP